MPVQDQVHSTDSRKSDTELSKQSTPEKKTPTHEAPSHGVMVETMDGVRCCQPDSPCANGGPPNNGRPRRHHNVRSISESACDHSPIEFTCPNENEAIARADSDSFNDDVSDLPFPPFPDEVLLPLPPDGGWGWVIVAASFVCCAVIDGLCSVFGVLLPDLVNYFGESSSKVSLAGSVLAGGFLLSGPVASVIINCFGCRWATIVGAILSATSLITCIYSTSVLMFILLFGALGGLGIGLIYLPASVMVGYYFERRRGLAAGISSAGAGFGMLTLTLLAAFLVQQYSWKGCLMIMAGVSLQCLVCGALMRPLVPTLSVLRPEAFRAEDEGEDQKKPAVARSKLVQPKFSPNLEVINENVALSPSPAPKQSEPPADTSDRAQNTAEVVGAAGLSPGNERQSHAVTRRLVGVGSCVELDRRRDGSVSTTKPINAAKRRRVSQERLPCETKDYHSCQELSYGKTVGSLLGLPFKRATSIILEPAVNPLMKKDIFYSGSFASLQNSMPRSDKDAESNVVSLSDMYHPAAFEQKKVASQAVHMLKEMMDVSILCNASFLIICSSSVLIQLAYFVPIVFLPAYGLSVGLSSGQAAMLLAVAGLSTTFGRATAGALASLRCVNGLHLNCLSLIVAGIATNFVYLCTSFEQLMLYGAVFGISVSGFVPMTTVFLVKYIGLDKLTNSFGLLSMIKGIATMAGPPIAGALLDSTGSYDSPFLFSGCLFVAAGVLFYFLPLTHKPVSLRHECAPFYCAAKRSDHDDEMTDFHDDLIEGDASGQTFGSH